MRIPVIAAALYLLVGCTDAQVRAPVNVAHELYTGCMYGTSLSIKPGTEVELRKYIQALDKQCLVWMATWYQPVMGINAVPIGQWSNSQYNRLNSRRLLLLNDLDFLLIPEFKVK